MAAIKELFRRSGVAGTGFGAAAMSPPDRSRAIPPGAQRLAPYACRPEDSRGRAYPEPESATRSCYQRDRDRIIHSVAFRRLKHKTQVFVYHEGDHYRTRLTHSIEVAQIARSISRAMGLNEDLAEALALAHDLGHTPFGHAGEEALAAVMAPYGGFDHNEQTFRILTRLERRYAEFDGLNLTWETLEGVAKHNGPLVGPAAKPGSTVRPSIEVYDRDVDLDLAGFPSAEAQVAALSDDIAYNNHDIDDGLRAGLFTIAELEPIPLVGTMFAEVRSRYPGIEEQRLIHETVRRLINAMVNDLIAETSRRLEAAEPGNAADLRALGAPVVAFSEPMRQNDRALKDFLFRRMYRHERVTDKTAEAKPIVRDLFGRYMEATEDLPPEWRAEAQGRDERTTARLIADYIAGMTDRFALAEHRALFHGGGRS